MHMQSSIILNTHTSHLSSLFTFTKTLVHLETLQLSGWFKIYHIKYQMDIMKFFE